MATFSQSAHYKCNTVVGHQKTHLNGKTKKVHPKFLNQLITVAAINSDSFAAKTAGS
jgi:hypothetical protein